MRKNFLRQNSHLVFSFFLGFMATICQVVLLREMVTVFYGNEIAYAVMLGSWLFWTGLGSLGASRLLKGSRDPLSTFTFLQLGIFFMAPVVLILIRCIKPLMNIPVGQIIGIIPMSAMAFILLAPLTLLFGAAFPFICHLPMISSSKEEGMAQVAPIYIWESLGATI